MLTTGQGRAEMTVDTLQRENRYHEDKASDLKRKVVNICILFPSV